jgi:hypothetical protein
MPFMETGTTACPRESAALEHVIYERALSPPAAQREAAMRELIAGSGAPFDIEDFIEGNPYLR